MERLLYLRKGNRRSPRMSVAGTRFDPYHFGKKQEAGDPVAEHAHRLVGRRRKPASDRLRGIAKGSYGPDPDAYLRELRDESAAAIRERQTLAGRKAPQGPPYLP